MTAQNRSDVTQFLRVVAIPGVLLGAATFGARWWTPQEVPSHPTVLPLVSWALGVWLLAAMCWSTSRPRRDGRAAQRLQLLRAEACAPDRALVHLHTTVWASAAGQHAVVVNVATGVTHRLWLPETSIPVGAFALLGGRDGTVIVVDWVSPRVVEAAHRHDRRTCKPQPSACEHLDLAPEAAPCEAPGSLITEIEDYLENQ